MRTTGEQIVAVAGEGVVRGDEELGLKERLVLQHHQIDNSISTKSNNPG